MGNDTIDGGTGTDTANYAAAAAGVTVDLALAGAQNTIGDGIDTLINIENIDGSEFQDTLRGSSVGNRISGGGGHDTIYGMDGDDFLEGGAGNDAIDGGAGNDVINAGRGSASIVESDSLTGGLGADRFVFDSIYASGAGGIGSDIIQDFSASEGDKIDLRGIFAPGAPVTFTTGLVLTGIAGEVLIRKTFTDFGLPGVNQIVSIDIDGNGTADVGFQVHSNVLLTAGDFII